MSRLLYSLLMLIACPLIFVRVFVRARKEPRYKDDLSQRIGRPKGLRRNSVWVHAVSAGETIAAAGLVRALNEAGHHVILTNMTPAGRERAEALFEEELEQGHVQNAYAPYDLSFAVNEFFARAEPKALIVIDTELWPNMIGKAKQLGIPSYVVNGRLSEKSARGYARIRALSKPMFAAITQVFAQSESQADRFKQLGANKVVTAGSVKFDASLPDDLAAQVVSLQQRFGGRQVLLAASTHEGEEEIVLAAFDQYRRDEKLLVIAPRHVHRLAAVENLLEGRFTYQLHSSNRELEPDTSVYVLDTMGELIYFYAVCANALVCGSLVNVGGHNPMEPGMLGKPMMMGPFRRNIADIAEQFEMAGALRGVSSAEEIVAFWQAFNDDANLGSEMSSAALDVMKHNKGALSRVLKVILPDLGT